MSVDTPYKTEDPTILNLCDCSRGTVNMVKVFIFVPSFTLLTSCPRAYRCCTSRVAVQFQFGLLVVLATKLKSRYAGSCQASTPLHATVSYLQDARP